MALSAVAIRNARPREKLYKLADGNGLHLLVQPNGKKYWRLRYRHNGVEKMLALGPFPAVSLLDARHMRPRAMVEAEIAKILPRSLAFSAGRPKSRRKLDAPAD